ncbi:MAG: YigZ family protein [Bacilli bacterium]|nr:YigZ family protein [Bacilli bacterium]
MRTIKNNVSNEIIIKNYRFICLFMKINSTDISDILDKIKEEYPKATHYCYAYVYNDIQRFSDDGEPGGTAGIPMLNVLLKEELSNVLCVVIRYFGGIKLGAGGLVRAYTKSVTECLKVTDLMELEEGYKLRLKFNYNDEKQIKYLLKDSNILNEKYDLDVEYTVLVNNNVFDTLKNYNYEILEKTYIEKSSN